MFNNLLFNVENILYRFKNKKQKKNLKTNVTTCPGLPYTSIKLMKITLTQLK